MDQFLEVFKGLDIQSSPVETQLDREQSSALDEMVSTLLSLSKPADLTERLSNKILLGLHTVKQVARDAARFKQPLQYPGDWTFSTKFSSPAGSLLIFKSGLPPTPELGFQLDSRRQLFGNFYLKHGAGDESQMDLFDVIQDKGQWRLRNSGSQVEFRMSTDTLPGEVLWNTMPDMDFLDRFFSQISIDWESTSIFGSLSVEQNETSQAQLDELLCPQCGKVVTQLQKFCRHCGGALAATRSPAHKMPSRKAAACPRCGDPIRPSEKFCNHCGYKFASKDQ